MNTLIELLEGVQEKSNGQYYAKCPAHDDKSPSLSVKVESDGTVLVHCFAGCEPLEVVQSVGLSLSDLFPEALDVEPRKTKHNPRDLLNLLGYEATFLFVCANHMRRGHALNENDFERLTLSYRKITAMRESI